MASVSIVNRIQKPSSQDLAKDVPSGSMLVTDLVESCRDLDAPS